MSRFLMLLFLFSSTLSAMQNEASDDIELGIVARRSEHSEKQQVLLQHIRSAIAQADIAELKSLLNKAEATDIALNRSDNELPLALLVVSQDQEEQQLAPMLQLLLNKGVDANAQSMAREITALHLLGEKPIKDENDVLSCCQQLFEAQADITLLDKNERTPLMICALHGNCVVAKALLEHGKALCNAGRKCDQKVSAACSLATSAGDEDFVNLLNKYFTKKQLQPPGNKASGLLALATKPKTRTFAKYCALGIAMVAFLCVTVLVIVSPFAAIIVVCEETGCRTSSSPSPSPLFNTSVPALNY